MGIVPGIIQDLHSTALAHVGLVRRVRQESKHGAHIELRNAPIGQGRILHRNNSPANVSSFKYSSPNYVG